MGAWIEIYISFSLFALQTVAPLVGAWIEIEKAEQAREYFTSRSSRGSVD